MKINNIILKNFRNIENKKLISFKKINFLVGKNGVGKTSIIEAIHVMLTGKSFKTNDVQEVINFNHDHAIVSGEVMFDSKFKIDCFIKDKVEFKLNETKSTKKEIGNKAVVIAFDPESLSSFITDKRYRRKFVDMQIKKIYPIHQFNLRNINKFEQEKKEMLKNNPNEKLIQIINKKLADEYYEVIDRRTKYLKLLNEYFIKYASKFNFDNSKLLIKQESKFIYKDSKQILNILSGDFSEEKTSRKIVSSIYKDDFKIYLDDIDTLRYSSQGQKRSLILSLLLGMISCVEKLKNIKPIILLDEVFSELDNTNQVALASCFTSVAQVFITAVFGVKYSEKDSTIINL